ncbi:MAG: hypothetical protein L7H11_06920 [Sulfolobales archaeon]|nr:hypothetical protein [Sulfolobales archaeon]
MTAISLKDVRKSFGKFQALKGVSFNVQEGSVTGFVGPQRSGEDDYDQGNGGPREARFR